MTSKDHGLIVGVIVAPAVPEFFVDLDNIMRVADAKVNIGVQGGRPPTAPLGAFDPSDAGVVLTQPSPDLFTVQSVAGIKHGTY